ncbi:MAG: transporter permease [Tardiphaga sp.]|jgi:peptide/nickel transport system permease protein|nr:transporter permease [Tardiphaga sp.]
MTIEIATPSPRVSPFGRVRSLLRRSPGITFALIVLVLLILGAVLAPMLHTVDPAQINPRLRLRAPDARFWLGSDALGRDVWSRIVFGSRISLTVGISVAALSLITGTLLGLLAGMVSWLDGVLMRTMDGLMAIPAILLAIALIGSLGANLATICFAITLPEIPRVARLVRSVILTVKTEAYVEAAISMGTRLPGLMWFHILPNILAPLIVQGTYIASSAILIEAALSFLGIGIADGTPSWGNIMADARVYFTLAPWLMFAPGLCIALTVLAFNQLGDGLRDLLDPRLARSVRSFS